jgi:hypothetical protein
VKGGSPRSQRGRRAPAELGRDGCAGHVVPHPAGTREPPCATANHLNDVVSIEVASCRNKQFDCLPSFPDDRTFGDGTRRPADANEKGGPPWPASPLSRSRTRAPYAFSVRGAADAKEAEMTVSSLELPKRAQVVHDAVHINDLEITSPDVVAGARRYIEAAGRDEVGDYVVQAIEVGAKAMLFGSTTVDVDAINTALRGLSGGVAEVATGAVEEIRAAVTEATNAENGTLARAVERILGDLGDQVSALVAGEDAPVRSGIERAVTGVTDKALGEIQRSLAAQTATVKGILSSDGPDTPLGAMRHDFVRTVRDVARDLSDQIGALKTAVEVQRAQAIAMERTTAKGLSYQSDVLDALDRITHAAGDVLERTHDTVGEVAKCKTGDGVVTLSEAVSRERSVRVVVEAKDMTQSAEAWRQELARACVNRKSVAALGVIRGVEHMPGRTRVKVLDRLHIHVAFDPDVDDLDLLIAAFHLLRVQAACAAVEGAAEEVDLAAVREHVDAAIHLLDDFDRVDKAGSAAQRGLDDIRKHSSKLHQDLLERLMRGLRVIDSGSAAA